MKPFILTHRAEQDICDIWDYIADDNIEAADRVLDALENALHRIAKNPGIGHMREELAESICAAGGGDLVRSSVTAREAFRPDFSGQQLRVTGLRAHTS